MIKHIKTKKLSIITHNTPFIPIEIWSEIVQYLKNWKEVLVLCRIIKGLFEYISTMNIKLKPYFYMYNPPKKPIKYCLRLIICNPVLTLKETKKVFPNVEKLYKICYYCNLLKDRLVTSWDMERCKARIEVMPCKAKMRCIKCKKWKQEDEFFSNVTISYEFLKIHSECRECGGYPFFRKISKKEKKAMFQK